MAALAIRLVMRTNALLRARLAETRRSLAENEDAFRSQTAGWLLRTHHCTRLLDHEVAAIRDVGLRLLSEDLVSKRLEDAVARGYMTSEEGRAIAAANVFAKGQQQYREGQICLILSRHPLRTEPDAVWRLLTTWGGEAIYFGHVNTPLEDTLRALGRPTVIVADVDLSQGWQTHPVFPGVLHSFVGRSLGFPDYASDVFYGAPISPSQIAGIWQPGHAEYDRHHALPGH